MKGKKIKEIDPRVGALKTLAFMSDSSVMKDVVKAVRSKENVYNTKWDKIVVDTCIAFDTGTWETGISQDRGENLTIVGQYKNRAEAEEGHKGWVKLLKENPKADLEDIDLWGLNKLRDKLK